MLKVLRSLQRSYAMREADEFRCAEQFMREEPPVRAALPPGELVRA